MFGKNELKEENIKLKEKISELKRQNKALKQDLDREREDRFEVWRILDEYKSDLYKKDAEIKSIKEQSDNDIGSEYLSLENLQAGILARIDYYEFQMNQAKKIGATAAVDRYFIARKEALDIYNAIDDARNDKWRAKNLSKLVARDIDRVANKNGFTRNID